MLISSLICLSLILGFGKVSQAAISIPKGAVGISEATYQELKQAQFIDAENYDQILCAYQNKIVFRAEHAGEMYRVNLSASLPALTRYLPDGFYKAGQKYYWVNAGTKYRMKKGHAYEKIFTAVNATDNKAADIIGLTASDFTSMQQKDSQGVALYQNLSGRIVLNAEGAGELYYINGTAKTMTAIAPQMNYPLESFYKFIKDNATSVDKTLIKGIANRNY